MLDNGDSWDALMRVTPSNPLAAAHGYMRVMPGDPSKSLLLSKLANTLDPGEGTSMPYGAALLPTHTVAVIRAWIAAGAPHDGVVAGDDGKPLGLGDAGSNDINLPPPLRGVQLKVTAAAIPDGKEETSCHYLKLPSDVDLDATRFEIAVSGGSHHIHLYRPYDSTLDIPDGFETCNTAVDFDKWELVAASQLRATDWQLPSGIGYHFRAGEQLLVQTHFVNIGSLETRGEGKVVMNIHAATPGTIVANAGAIFGQDKDVFVPAHSVTTKAAGCTFPKDITLMAQTGHYHFRGRHFTTYRFDNGERGEKLYDYQGYSDPPFLVYPVDNMPLFDAGQGLEWECQWENTTPYDFKFGPFTDTNEHCNWFGFYFPTDSQNEAITCVTKDAVQTTTIRHGN